MAPLSPLNAGTAFRHSCRSVTLALMAAFTWALPGCEASPARAQPPTHTAVPIVANLANAISSVTLERNCLGCSGGSVLVLHRDGTATFNITGNARQGTADQISRSQVAPADFDALANWVVVNNFFTLQDIYEEPGLRDGAWGTICVARDAATAPNTPPKCVFWRENAGPTPLKAVETAIENLRARLVFKPERR